MLTFGQASCLVLGLSPTDKNRKIAKERMKDIEMVPTYLHGSDPQIPLAIGTKVIELNPYRFCSYPETAPPSPRLNSEIDHDQNNENIDASHSSDTNNSEEIKAFVTKQSALEYLKETLFVNKPSNIELYEEVFVTSDMLLNLLKQRFGNIKQTKKQIEYWVTQCNHWGGRTKTRLAGKVLSGRRLWKVKDIYLDSVSQDNTRAYKRHIKSHVMTTIGYSRKSRTGESQEARTRLLQNMVDRLFSKNLCSKIYVSPLCNADEKIIQRDLKEDSSIYIKHLNHCNGDMQHLIQRLRMNFKPVRLVIIDYAGLSTNPVDIRRFVSKYTQIKELVVDHGTRFEIFTRHELLKDNNAISKFNCRRASVKRSQV